MASPIFHKLHAARRNPGLFDHINQNNDQAGPTKIYNTIQDFAKRGLYLTLRCDQCHISGAPKASENIPIRDIIFSCPNCNNTSLEQDIGPTINNKHHFIGTKKIIKPNENNAEETETILPPTTQSTIKHKQRTHANNT